MQDLDRKVASVGGMPFASDPLSQRLAPQNLPGTWGQPEMDQKTPNREQDHGDLSVSTAISLDSGICVEADVVQRSSCTNSTASVGSPVTRAHSHSISAASVRRSSSPARRLVSPRHFTSPPMTSPDSEEIGRPSNVETWKAPVKPTNVSPSDVQGDGITGLVSYW